MKRTFCLFLALLSLPIYGSAAIVSSVAQSGTRALLNGISSICTPSNMCKAVVGGAALSSVALYAKMCGIVKNELDRMEKSAAKNPILDCPVKRNITKKFADHGYEVFFVRKCGSTMNAAVLAYGKKVAFFVFDNGKHTFFNDPKLDAARDGIIEHEMAHVLNGDINQRIMSISLAVPMVAACVGCTAVVAAACNPKDLLTSLSSVSAIPSVVSRSSVYTGKAFSSVSSQIAERIPSALQKKMNDVGPKVIKKMALVAGMAGVGGFLPSLEYCVRQGVDLTCRTGAAAIAGGAALYGSTVFVAIGVASLSRYQEKRADYAALKLKNPAILDGMAQFFKKLAVHDRSQKSWSDWLHFKMTASHPCSCDRHKYLEREAAKMRQRQAIKRDQE